MITISILTIPSGTAIITVHMLPQHHIALYSNGVI